MGNNFSGLRESQWHNESNRFVEIWFQNYEQQVPTHRLIPLQIYLFLKIVPSFIVRTLRMSIKRRRENRDQLLILCHGIIVSQVRIRVCLVIWDGIGRNVLVNLLIPDGKYLRFCLSLTINFRIRFHQATGCDTKKYS